MTKRDLTYAINAAVAEAIAHGATRAEIENLIYQMRQKAQAEEAGSEPSDVPPDPPKAA
jgi:hypothetical protein